MASATPPQNHAAQPKPVKSISDKIEPSAEKQPPNEPQAKPAVSPSSTQNPAITPALAVKQVKNSVFNQDEQTALKSLDVLFQEPTLQKIRIIASGVIEKAIERNLPLVLDKLLTRKMNVPEENSPFIESTLRHHELSKAIELHQFECLAVLLKHYTNKISEGAFPRTKESISVETCWEKAALQKANKITDLNKRNEAFRVISTTLSRYSSSYSGEEGLLKLARNAVYGDDLENRWNYFMSRLNSFGVLNRSQLEELINSTAFGLAKTNEFSKFKELLLCLSTSINNNQNEALKTDPTFIQICCDRLIKGFAYFKAISEADLLGCNQHTFLAALSTNGKSWYDALFHEKAGVLFNLAFTSGGHALMSFLISSENKRQDNQLAKGNSVSGYAVDEAIKNGHFKCVHIFVKNDSSKLDLAAVRNYLSAVKAYDQINFGNNKPRPTELTDLETELKRLESDLVKARAAPTPQQAPQSQYPAGTQFRASASSSSTAQATAQPANNGARK